MAGPIQVEVTRGERRRGRPHACTPSRSRDGAIVARPATRGCHVPALLGEAAPGAAARPGAPRPRRPRDRDRLRVAPRRCPSSSTPSARCSPRRRRPRTSSRPAAEPRPRSSTTARASTPGSSPSAARAATRRGATGSPEHPLQQELLAEIAAAAGVDPGDDAGRDRRLRRPDVRAAARAHARTRSRGCRGSTAGTRVVAAMRAHPEMLRRAVAADAMLIRELPGWVAKGGAEGLFCAGSPDGLGDRAQGRGRSVPGHSPCSCRMFSGSSASTPASSASSPVENSRGERVGVRRRIRAVESRVPKRRSRV